MNCPVLGWIIKLDNPFTKVNRARTLLLNRAILGNIWQSFRAFPLIGQLGVGLLLLQLVAGPGIWQMPWPLWLRLVLVSLGIAPVYPLLQLPLRKAKREISEIYHD